MNIYDAIENVCEKCGQQMSYPYWATNIYTCIRCGYTEKQKTHSEVEDEEKTMLLANLDMED